MMATKGMQPNSASVRDAHLNAALAHYIDRFYNKSASIPAWDTIHRSSMNAWSSPSEVSTKADEDHVCAAALRAFYSAPQRGR
jgi:hypothetical protein